MRVSTWSRRITWRTTGIRRSRRSPTPGNSSRAARTLLTAVFVLLAPGVTRPDRQMTAGGVTSTLQDSGFSFGGLRPRSNTLTIPWQPN
jgi:hypothetical protein